MKRSRNTKLSSLDFHFRQGSTQWHQGLKEAKSGAIMNHDVGYIVTSCPPSVFGLLFSRMEGPVVKRLTRPGMWYPFKLL